MANSQKKIERRISLSPDDKEKLEHDAALCGMSQNEYIRQLLRGNRPSALPPREFMEILREMYEIRDSVFEIAEIAKLSESPNAKNLRTLADSYCTITKEFARYIYDF